MLIEVQVDGQKTARGRPDWLTARHTIKFCLDVCILKDKSACCPRHVNACLQAVMSTLLSYNNVITYSRYQLSLRLV